ncbi:hypothetical protein L3C95_21710 [Chitinophaga filiformis]|uniref:hypothetical protein n=1 Tax=Chitinophaga filiformis TaxID=104663 RepID=UPI001F1E78E8|nr:hypothetical protein [Chitinophaga filiformis]MCF6405528.1 hypothetical protein [Chitinophaga filiformis]MCF6405536.1 hypothetical protein [Chitinophaga filiformis]
MTIEEKLEQGYFAGCIKYKNEYGFYLMPIAYWILNMNTYDPDYDPSEDEFVFRNNVEVVSDDKILDFFSATEEYRISYQMLSAASLLHVIFFIDFDAKLFVSWFNDIEVETYLPDNSWKGLFDDPNKYIPFKDIEE